MEEDLEHLATTASYSESESGFNSQKRVRQIYHVKSHYVRFICECDYVASYRDTGTKYGGIKHPYDKQTVAQVSTKCRLVARRYMSSSKDEKTTFREQ